VVDAAAAPAFVGRAVELERLEASLARATAGTPGIVLIGGEAGIGKTRLVEEFARQARERGARVLIGECLRIGDGGLPFAPFVAALRELVRGVQPGELPALLGPGRSRLARLVPELDGTMNQEGHGLDSRRRARAQLFEAVLDTLERVARQVPLVLVIENLQWADSSSLDLLSYLAQVIREGRILIVATVRSDEIRDRDPLLTHLAELERIDVVERLELGPLGRRDVWDLVERALGGGADDELVDALLERTDGNPFFVEQLLDARREAEAAGGSGAPEADPDDPTTLDLAPRLRDVLLARVAGLSAPAREVLRAAAAAGRLVDDELLAAVVELPAREIREALREAVDRRILVAVDDPRTRDAEGTDPPVAHAFRHELLREVVLGELFAGERQRLHAGFAAALSARATDPESAGTEPPDPAELAYHWDAAHDWPRALQACVEAGFAAEHTYAFAEAWRHDERALELWDRIADADRLVLGDRVSLIERTAEVASLVGEHRRAVELGRAAIAAIPAGEDDARRALLHERLRWFLWEAGDRVAAEAALREAASLSADGPPSAARARFHAHRAALDMAAGRFAVSRGGAEVALAEARATGARVEEALALGVLGWDTALLGDIDGGIVHLETARAIAADVDNIEGEALGWTTLAELQELVGRADAAVASARAGVADAERLGVARTYGGRLRATEGAALLALGRWEEAARAIEAGFDARPTGRAETALLVEAARLDTGQGRFAQAARRLDAARTVDDTLGGGDDRPAILAATVELAVWRGSIAEVRAAADEAVRIAERHRSDPALGRLLALAVRAEADVATRARARHDDAAAAGAGKVAAGRARTLAAWAVDRAASAPGVAVRFEAAAALARVELARCRGPARPDDWQAIATGLQAASRPVEAAYAWFREGEARLAARGSREAATTALRSAHAVATEVGAKPLAAEVATLARLAGIELVAGGPDADAHPALAGLGLTAREAEVLRLVAGGWTNQQIADALFIARKTASVHVSNILGKLGVDSRVEAAAIAHRLGFGAGAPAPPDAA
jgi:DNA-binding CsgD family transcriptional regulator/tetratricopeptide (TPR) repeat protein